MGQDFEFSQFSFTSIERHPDKMKTRLEKKFPAQSHFILPFFLISMIYSQIPQNKLDENIPKRKYIITNTWSIWMITILVKFWIFYSLVFFILVELDFFAFTALLFAFYPFYCKTIKQIYISSWPHLLKRDILVRTLSIKRNSLIDSSLLTDDSAIFTKNRENRAY